MMRLLLLMLTLFSALSLNWVEFQVRFPGVKIYLDSEINFLENSRFIEQQSGPIEYGYNQFTHLSNKQYASMFNSLVIPDKRFEQSISFNLSLPQNKNWVTDGAVTPVKDQGQCGSCWSFSTTGAMEGSYMIKSGKLISLSEQQFVDCSKMNSGCNGGLPDRAFKYAEKTQICSESDYVYTAKDGTCETCIGSIPKLTSYTDVPKESESELQKSVYLTPIAVAIQADSKEFQLYKSGIMDFNCGTDLDHAVLLVGYGTDNGVDYWLLKNSWGTTWGTSAVEGGENGYFKLIRGKNMCGIANSASYPTF